MEDHELQATVAALSRRVALLEEQLAAMRVSSASAGAKLSSQPRALGDDRASRAEPADFRNTTPAQPVIVTSAAPRPQPSLESRIGSQLFNRIGILALLIGAAWFLKFAIDQRWIGPTGRVLVGVIAGAVLVGWSEWFRLRGYKAFSYSLKALGTGILYLSLWAAYSLFALIPFAVALVAMVLVTAGNAWLCWLQNSEVLAFYAAAGGLLTPLLLWNAESQEAILFGYLLLLDLAMLALVALRPWSRLLLVAFAGTAVYAVGWYVQRYTPVALSLTTFFVVVFFLLFAAAPQLLRNLRLASAGARLTAEDHLALLLLPLLNGLLAFAELYALLSEPVSTVLRSSVAFGFAAFYLAMLFLAHSPRLAGTPRRLVDTYLLLSVIAFTGGLALAFTGRAIAVCWSAESVLLFFLATRLPGRMLRSLAASVLALAFVSTVTLNTALRGGEMRMLLNPRFGTYAVGAVGGLLVALLAAKELRAVGDLPELAPDWRRAGLLATWGATILLMIGVCLDIGAYWSGQHQLPLAERLTAEQFSYSAWTMLLGAFLLAVGFWRKLPILRWQGLVLFALSIAKVFLFDLRSLSQGYRILSFLALGILLVGISFVYQRDLLGLRKQE